MQRIEIFAADDNIQFDVVLYQADGRTPLTLNTNDTVTLIAKRPQDSTPRTRAGVVSDGPGGRVTFTIPSQTFPPGDYQAQVRVTRSGGVATIHSEVFQLQSMRNV
jgi:hypothetical protein